jgi:hypothetical protein
VIGGLDQYLFEQEDVSILFMWEYRGLSVLQEALFDRIIDHRFYVFPKDF